MDPQCLGIFIAEIAQFRLFAESNSGVRAHVFESKPRFLRRISTEVKEAQRRPARLDVSIISRDRAFVSVPVRDVQARSLAIRCRRNDGTQSIHF